MKRSKKQIQSSPSCDNTNNVTACYCTHQKGTEPIDNSSDCLAQKGTWVSFQVKPTLCDCLASNVCPLMAGCYWDSSSSSCLLRTCDASEE